VLGAKTVGSQISKPYNEVQNISVNRGQNLEPNTPNVIYAWGI
jgi:hypothetical protein